MNKMQKQNKNKMIKLKRKKKNKMRSGGAKKEKRQIQSTYINLAALESAIWLVSLVVR